MRYAQKVSGSAFVAEMKQAAQKVAAASEMLDVIVSEITKISENLQEVQRTVQASQKTRQDDPAKALVQLYKAYHTISKYTEQLDKLRDKLSLIEDYIAAPYNETENFYEKVLGIEDQDVSIDDIIDETSSEISQLIGELNDGVVELTNQASKLREDKQRLIDSISDLSSLLEENDNVWTKECSEYFQKVLYPLAADEITIILPTLEALYSKMQNVIAYKKHFFSTILTAIEDMEGALK